MTDTALKEIKRDMLDLFRIRLEDIDWCRQFVPAAAETYYFEANGILDAMRAAGVVTPVELYELHRELAGHTVMRTEASA